MTSYSISGELNFMAKPLDDFGSPISGCLDLGSFVEHSPQRETKLYRRGERGSPTYRDGNSYISSPRDVTRYQQQRRQQQAPFSYHGGPPSSGYSFSSYHSPPYSGSDQTAPWDSPSDSDYDQRLSPPQHKPTSYDTPTSPPSRKSRRWEGSPEEIKFNKKMRSPFRSPISNPGAVKKFKRSPIWGGIRTPSTEMCRRSFGMMDAPRAQMDTFSPMGPSFASFENDSPSLLLEEEVLNTRMGLVAGDYRQVPSPAIPQRRTARSHLSQGSPGFNFINAMTHMPSSLNLPSLPVRGERVSRQHQYPCHDDKDRIDRSLFDRPPPMSDPPPPMRSGPSSTTSKRTIYTSLFASSSHQHTDRRASWDDSRQAPRPFRLELGDNFAKPSETRQGLKKIKSILRGAPSIQRSGPLPNHPGAFNPGGLLYCGGRTQGKEIGGPSGRMRQSRRRRHGPQSPYASLLPPRQGDMSLSAPRYPTTLQPLFPGHLSSNTPRFSEPPSKIRSTQPSDAEKMFAPSSQRRKPCNCKKSKCLKLYCECYASEMYCDGCNCNDCRNNKTYEDTRSKAMKDTRTKNPNAFKPRFVSQGKVGPSEAPPSTHNMGCKCKRSQCLKKYCECFQAGVVCGNKCKCVDCLNYVGSQALIDKRRNFKDYRGADVIMFIADEALHSSSLAARVSSTPSSSSSRYPLPSPTSTRPSRSSNDQHKPSAPHHILAFTRPAEGSNSHLWRYSKRGTVSNKPRAEI